MPETREDDFASRAATYFVFIFLIAAIIETMLADPNVDLLLCPITGALPSMGNKLCEDLVAAAATTDKPVFVVWGSPVGDEEAYRTTLLQSAVPTFRTFTNAVMAARFCVIWVSCS